MTIWAPNKLSAMGARDQRQEGRKRWSPQHSPEFVSPGLSPASSLHAPQPPAKLTPQMVTIDSGERDWAFVAPSAVCACYPIGHRVRWSKPGFERTGPNVGPAVDRMDSVTSAASISV
jgi:hypothetical protein